MLLTLFLLFQNDACFGSIVLLRCHKIAIFHLADTIRPENLITYISIDKFRFNIVGEPRMQVKITDN